jgi:hypothetical protein
VITLFNSTQIYIYIYIYVRADFLVYIYTYSCGYDQMPNPASHPFDGVLGLGKGQSSIVSQLSRQGLVRNVIGHCLSGRGGGYLFFGDGPYDSSRVLWTSMSHDHP